ncbi:MAG: DUF1579 domain-containing protein [Acidobacteria bacterium]|nr:MAG: DUF1579 domain-containing protein [Acidobacteriota bacterium]
MKRYLAGLAVASLFIIPTLAQTPSGPPKPGPEHQRLAYFVGTWTVEGEEKPTPFGPGGKFTGTATAEWFSGGFFLFGRADSKGAMGEVEEMSLMGYSGEEKAYTFYVINSLGHQVYAKGTVTGDTWTWIGESKVMGKPIKGQFVIKETSPTSYTFKGEMSIDGQPLQVYQEGKATKK